MPLAAGILEITDKFFFLAVHRNARLATPQLCLDLAVDLLELRVEIRVISLFPNLSVRLETIARVLGQPAARYESDLIPLIVEFLSQLSETLGGPPQRRLRVAPGPWLYEPVQCLEQRGVGLGYALPSSPGPTHTPCICSLGSQVSNSTPDRAHGQPSCTMHLCDSASTNCQCFGSCPCATSTLAQCITQQFKLLAEHLLCIHADAIGREGAVG